MQGNDSFPFGIRVNSQSFKQIPEKLLEEARSNAYSLERREKQGGLEYLGSEIPGAQKRAGVDKMIPNSERDADIDCEETSIIYGEDYDWLADSIADVLGITRS